MIQIAKITSAFAARSFATAFCSTCLGKISVLLLPMHTCHVTLVYSCGHADHLPQSNHSGPRQKQVDASRGGQRRSTHWPSSLLPSPYLLFFAPTTIVAYYYDAPTPNKLSSILHRTIKNEDKNIHPLTTDRYHRLSQQT